MLKKILALLLALMMVACATAALAEEEAEAEAPEEAVEETADEEAAEPEEDDEAEDVADDEEAEEGEEEAEFELISYEDYTLAEFDAPVYIETYVQATQSWWDDKITVYAQSEDGAVFIYNMLCSQEDAEKLVPGTKIAVKGYKAEWAGEIEIADATFEFVDGDPYIAEPVDVTELLGTEDLINNQNELVAFTGMTVEPYDESGAAFAYKDAEGKTDDLYFKVSKDGQTLSCCVEFYLCGQDTDVYKAVEALQVGDVIDLVGFLYWYEGANPHIVAVTPAAE